MKIKKIKGRADRVIQFIEKLKVPSGKDTGKRFKLIPEHKKFIRAIYEPHAMFNGKPKMVVRNAVLSKGRKNAKTTIIACLVLAHLIGPEAIMNNEIYSAANDKKQAAIVFKICAQIIKLCPELASLLRVTTSTKTISCYANGSSYEAMSRESGTKHGMNPGLVIYDELAQAKDMDLFEVLDSAMGARFEPLMIVISTQSKDPQHILSQMIDDGIKSKDPTIVCHLYAVDESVQDEQYCKKCKVRFKPTKKDKKSACPQCEGETTLGIYDPAVWKQANPALGKFLYLDYIKAKAARAERLPSFENSFMNLHLNMRVDSTASLISRKEWLGCLDPDCALVPGEDIYLGLDLSKKTDLTALVAISAENGDRVQPWFWKPKELMEEHEKRDRAPYEKWEKEGFLNVVPGKVIDLEYIAIALNDVMQTYNVVGLAYDRWRMDVLIKDLGIQEIECFEDGEDENDGLRLCPWGQGFRDMGYAIDEFEVSILNGNLKHNGNPVLTWNFSNAVSISDPSGNRKLDKDKARFRIDGAVATVMAKGLKSRDKPEIDLVDIDAFLSDPLTLG